MKYKPAPNTVDAHECIRCSQPAVFAIRVGWELCEDCAEGEKHPRMTFTGTMTTTTNPFEVIYYEASAGT